MRVLVLGNSHAASLARAWRDAPKAGLQMEFLAATGLGLEKIIEVDRTLGRLVFQKHRLNVVRAAKHLIRPPGQSNANFVELNGYDRIVVYGLQLLTGRLPGILGDLGEGDGGQKWFNVLEDSRGRFSDSAWDAACREFARDTGHYRFAESLAPEIRAKTISLPCPFPINEHPRAKAASQCDRERVDQALILMKKEMDGLGVRFSHLPASLTDPTGYLSAAEYRKDLIGDFVHLNAKGSNEVLSFVAGLLVN